MHPVTTDACGASFLPLRAPEPSGRKVRDYRSVLGEGFPEWGGQPPVGAAATLSLPEKLLQTTAFLRPPPLSRDSSRQNGVLCNLNSFSF